MEVGAIAKEDSKAFERLKDLPKLIQLDTKLWFKITFLKPLPFKLVPNFEGERGESALTHEWGRSKETGRQNPEQTLQAEPNVRLELTNLWDHNLWDHDLSQNQELDA